MLCAFYTKFYTHIESFYISSENDPFTVKSRQLFKLITLCRASARRFTMLEIRCLTYTELGHTERCKWNGEKKNKTKHLSMFRDEQLWTSCNFLYFYGAKKHRWIFRVRLLPVVQLLVILGCNLWLQMRVCAQTCCVIRYRGKIAYGNMWYSETQTEPLYLKPSTFEVLHFRFFFLFVFGSAKLSC